MIVFLWTILGARDVESMRAFVLEETEKAVAAAVDEHLQDDKDLWFAFQVFWDILL